MLVIMTGGIDLSVPGTLTLGAILMVGVGQQSDERIAERHAIGGHGQVLLEHVLGDATERLASRHDHRHVVPRGRLAGLLSRWQAMGYVHFERT